MAFGQYPDVSLEKARKRCQDARTLLADGIDPMAVRKQKKTEARKLADGKREKQKHTFRAVALRYHTHWKQGLSAKHTKHAGNTAETNERRIHASS